MEFLIQTETVTNFNSILKIFFITIYTFYISLKLSDNQIYSIIREIKLIILIIIIDIIYLIIKIESNFLYSTIFLILLLSTLFAIETKKKIGYSVLINIIALSINYILFFIALAISFIPNVIFKITNNLIGICIVLANYTILIYLFLRKRRLKNGFVFLHKKLENDNMDIIILNISIIILFAIIIISNYEKIIMRGMIFGFITFSIIMFITIQKSLHLYYKQKLLEQELNETKDELEKKKEEVKQLETENLNFSKTSHTLAHKQKSLEYKLEQLKQKYEIAEEIEIEDRIKDISKEIYNKTPEVEISKTGILEIDDMLKYMQSECIKNNIEFRLQIKGNIYEMINNYISKEDLSILIADHVKNAIIAINYSENINKSILVRLGKINKIYSLYIYDSGIEFEKETLSNLGKIPSTTHADNGGTGMGFMNTFDTLRKYNASLIINEYNKPSNDNYTKSIVIKLDRRNEFTINSYKDKINN